MKCPLIAVVSFLLPIGSLIAEDFTKTGDMVITRRFHAATLLGDGTVLVTGGDESALRTAELYNPSTRTWRLVGSNMNFGHGLHTATRLTDGRVLIVSGFASPGSTAYSGVEIYDPVTQTFQIRAPMNVPRARHRSVMLNDGRVLVIGGYTAAPAEIYNPATDSWTLADPFPAQVSTPSLTVLPDGTALGAGGRDVNTFQNSAAVYRYVPATNKWQPMNPLLIGRNDQTATALPGGKVLFVSAGTSEVYDPSAVGGNGASLFGGNVNDPSAGAFSAVALPNGNVLLTGGTVDHSGPTSCHCVTGLDSAFLFDAPSRQWSPLPPINVPRGDHTSTTLVDGSVLIAGGYSYETGYLIHVLTMSTPPELWNGPPPGGFITILCNIQTATFVLKPSLPGFSGGPYPVMIPAPPESYTLLFNPQLGYITPPSQTLALLAGESITFSGVYLRPTLRAIPATVTFSYQSGSVGPIQPQVILASSDGPQLDLSITTSTNPAGDSWLSVLQSSGQTPLSIAINVRAKMPPGLYSGQVTISAANTANGSVVIPVSLIVAAGPPTVSAVRQFRIASGPVAEPSIGVDPREPLHAIVGFNDFTTTPPSCGWAETQSGGVLWVRGTLRFENGFTALGDPWVRYAPDGRLFYSCMASKNISAHTIAVGVFVATSQTGKPKDFEPAVPIVTVLKDCADCENHSERVDHPAIGIINTKTGYRIVACWVDFFQDTHSEYLYAANSPDGKLWLNQQVLGGPSAKECTVGGGPSEIAITWREAFSDAGDVLRAVTSKDGLSWSKPHTLGQVGKLLYPGVDDSTTSLISSEPYAVVVSANDGLRAIWQARVDTRSQLLFADKSGDAWGDAEIVTSASDRFLPSAGECSGLLGAYEGMAATSNLFQFKIWLQNSSAVRLPEVFSTEAISGQFGEPVEGHSLRRLGDYTGVGCSGNVGWAVWTDAPGPDHVREIWGVRFILP